MKHPRENLYELILGKILDAAFVHPEDGICFSDYDAAESALDEVWAARGEADKVEKNK